MYPRKKIGADPICALAYGRADLGNRGYCCGSKAFCSSRAHVLSPNPVPTVHLLTPFFRVFGQLLLSLHARRNVARRGHHSTTAWRGM
jgi:hypothetical protein